MNAAMCFRRKRNEMPGVDTGGVPAFVMDVEPVWHPTNADLVHPAVSFFTAKHGTEILVIWTSPRPALRRTFHDDEL
jgi:hypothetical protein